MTTGGLRKNNPTSGTKLLEELFEIPQAEENFSLVSKKPGSGPNEPPNTVNSQFDQWNCVQLII